LRSNQKITRTLFRGHNQPKRVTRLRGPDAAVLNTPRGGVKPLWRTVSGETPPSRQSFYDF